MSVERDDVMEFSEESTPKKSRKRAFTSNHPSGPKGNDEPGLEENVALTETIPGYIRDK